MAGQRHDDTLTDADVRALRTIERDLRDTLRAVPSPDFLARVRIRNADERMAHRFSLRWGVWSAAAATAVLLLTMMFVPRDRPSTPVPGGDAAKTLLPAPPFAEHVTSPPRHGATRSGRRPRGGEIPASHNRRASIPEVIVPPGQLEAIRRYANASRASPISARPLTLATNGVPAAPELLELPMVAVMTAPVGSSDPVVRGGSGNRR